MKNTIPLNTILARVCDHFNLNESDLRKEQKSRKLAYARQIYSYIAKNYSDKGFEKIGKKINRHHATTQFSVKKINTEKDLYSDVREDIRKIINSFSKIDFIVTNVDLLQISIENTGIDLN